MFPNKKVQALVGQKVQVEMKGEKNILEGTLVSADDYLNLHLNDTTEISNGQKVRSLGSVVLKRQQHHFTKPGQGVILR